MKKSIQILILALSPLFLMGQSDTTTYWFSWEHLKHTKRMNERLLPNDRSTLTNKAPNDREYNCACDGIENCCDKFEDSEMVCMTIDGRIVNIEAHKNRTAHVESMRKEFEEEAWRRREYTLNWLNITTDTVAASECTKDTIAVKVLCMNDRVVRGTFQDSEQIVGAEVYLTVKKMERTLEKQWVDASPTPVYANGAWTSNAVAYRKYCDVVISYRYLDDVEGCYHLVPLESEGR